MEKVVIGVDVAKEKLDVAIDRCNRRPERIRVRNTRPGHGRIVALASQSEDVLVVMEATGSYHTKLARVLHEANIAFSIVNPLVIKRYSQMKLRRVKTDRMDAMLIAEYGREHNPGLYKTPSKAMEQLRQLQSQIRLLTRQRTALSNQLHAHQTLPAPLTVCRGVSRQMIRKVDRSIAKLEAAQQEIIERAYPSERALLQSIMGIGPKVSSGILAVMGDMSQFDSYKQVAAFVGLNPVVVQSGTSLRPRSHISKQGHASVRTLLYLAALSAKRHNPACRLLYERLVAKGKPKKVALIAVANKLIKQAFAVLKSGRPYEPYYGLKLAIN